MICIFQIWSFKPSLSNRTFRCLSINCNWLAIIYCNLYCTVSWIHCSKKVCFRSMEFQFKLCIFICPGVSSIDVLRLIFIMPCSSKFKTFSISYIFVCDINDFHSFWNRIRFFHILCGLIYTDFTNHWNFSSFSFYRNLNLSCRSFTCSAKTFCADCLSFL